MDPSIPPAHGRWIGDTSRNHSRPDQTSPYPSDLVRRWHSTDKHRQALTAATLPKMDGREEHGPDDDLVVVSQR
ncbi:hypothetical protein VTN02DRAFT_5415 [Thermoascus thermophilus]